MRVASPAGLGPFQPGSGCRPAQIPPFPHRSIPSTCTPPEERPHLAQVNQLCTAPLSHGITQPQRLENPSKTTESIHHPDTAMLTAKPRPQRHIRTLFEHSQGTVTPPESIPAPVPVGEVAVPVLGQSLLPALAGRVAGRGDVRFHRARGPRRRRRRHLLPRPEQIWGHRGQRSAMRDER